MSKKILFTASTMSHIENFHLPYIEEFKRQGWEVKAVALPVSKRFFSFQNLRAIKYTRSLLLEERFDVISSHATLAGIVTRLAVMLAGKSRLSTRLRKSGKSDKFGKQVKIFHTAHGYLFHDDRSLKKWAYLIPEIICSRVTDILMVMNHEDLAIAQKYRLCKDPQKIYYINGMGIDLSRFQPREDTLEDRKTNLERRKAFGIGENDFVFVYAAEFSKRKNHELLLKRFAKAVEKLKDLEKNGELFAGLSDKRPKLVLAGDGALLGDMKALAANLEIQDRVVFLGYTKNMSELYPCCDVAVTTSRIEGLPFNVMEAMACGLPVIASDIKGHRELIEHGENGLLFEGRNLDELSDLMINILLDAGLRTNCVVMSLDKVKPFSISNVFSNINGIYESNI